MSLIDSSINNPQFPLDAWRLLSPSISDNRKKRLEHAAANRTEFIRLIVQDIHNPHNVSACLRSAEAFGVLNVDIVTLKEKFSPSTVARGASNWLNIERYVDIETCAKNVKASGFKIAAGFPDADAIPLDEIPIDEPITVLFGNEHDGVHKDWLQHIDYRFTIPMVGLVESLNISVCCAITLRELTRRAKKEVDSEKYFLNELSKNELLCKWICRQIRSYQGQLEKLRQH